MAVFDTGFHKRNGTFERQSTLVPYSVQKRIAAGFTDQYQYCAERAAQMLGAHPKALKIVSCHPGNGCSVTAIHEGRSIDTTMGFTPLEGLMMGTRCGSVDPAILTYLMRQDQLDAEGIDRVLNQKSGLLGVSGLSSDMRDILSAMQQGHERAKLAFDIYVHRLRMAIGGMTAILSGMDAPVFTGGVGENSAEVRAAGCRGLGFLGLHLNERANAQPSLDQDVSAPDSRVRVLVIQAEEDWSIAKESWRLARTSRLQQLAAN